jgi:hypothetical protein
VRRYLLSLLCVVAVLPALVDARGRAVDLPVQQPLLQHIARVVEDSPLPMRRDFSWLAITEMANMYSEEAERARLESRHTKRARDAAKWAASVDNYAARMQAMADAITSETSIKIIIGTDKSINLYVAGEPVILTGAFSGRQDVYEQRLIEQFCVLYLCERLLARLDLSTSDKEVLVRKRSGSAAYWSFSQYAGPVCMTDDGLEFQFREMTGINRKRAACNQIVAELYALLEVLVRSHDRGVPVDWPAVQIHPIADSAGHQVVLNGGEHIRLSLPALAASKDLFRLVRPWLAARAQGKDFHLVVLNAGSLMQGVDTGP